MQLHLAQYKTGHTGDGVIVRKILHMSGLNSYANFFVMQIERIKKAFQESREGDVING